MPAVSNNPSNNPDGNENTKTKSSRKETMAQQRNREEEEERRRKAKEDRQVATVAQAVRGIIEKQKLPHNGLLKVMYINGYKFRANYYVDHLIVWTKCVIMNAEEQVSVCATQ